LRTLVLSLQRLTARLSVARGGDLLRRAELGIVDTAAFDTGLGEIEARMMDELALVRVATVAPSWPLASGDGAFGAVVQEHFPEAAFHLDEAGRCLALRRPTAAILHAMQVVRIALAAQPLVSGNAGQPQTWQQVIGSARAIAGQSIALTEAVDRLRRQWQGPDLLSVGKSTEEEAEAVLDAVAAFLLALAAEDDARKDAGPRPSSR
jgi:hypothetical protein